MQLAELVLAAATASIALGACYRDRDSGATLEDRPDGGRAVAVAADPLAYLPADSDFVIGVDAQQIFQSALWRRFEAQLMRPMRPTLEAYRGGCGYDLLPAVRSFTLGMKFGTSDATVAVLRGLDRDRMMACLRQVTFNGGQKAVIDGRFATLPATPPMILTFVDATTAVSWAGPRASRAQLEAVIASSAPLRRSAAFTELWSLVDTRQAMWIVANGASGAFDALSSLGLRPRALLGSVGLASGLSLTGRLRLGTADEAQQLVSLAQTQLGMLKNMADRLDLAAEGVDLKVRVDMTQAQVEALVGMLLGAVGQGMGNPLGGP